MFSTRAGSGLSLLGRVAFALTVLTVELVAQTNTVSNAESIRRYLDSGALEERVRQAEAAGKESEAMGWRLQIARVAALLGDEKKVSEALKPAETWANENRNKHRWIAANVYAESGKVYLQLNRPELAVPALKQGYRLAAYHLGPYDMDVSFIQGYLGFAHLRNGDSKEAAGHLKDAATNLQQPHHLREWIGGAARRNVAAIGHFDRRLHLTERGKLEACSFLNTYAKLLQRQGKLRYEGNRLKEYRKMIETLNVASHFFVANILLRQSINAEARKSYGDAETHLRELIALCEKHKYLGVLPRRHLYDFCVRRGKTDEAAKVKGEIDAALATDAEREKLGREAETARATANLYPWETLNRNEAARN